MIALLLILCDCRVPINMLFKYFLQSDRPQLSSACIKNQLKHVRREIFNLKRNWPRNLREQICNCREQVVQASFQLLRANCQSKYQHYGRRLQGCAQKTSGSTVECLTFSRRKLLFHGFGIKTCCVGTCMYS